MKEKSIEKIPYLKLKKTIRSKKVKYIAVTAVRNISHERHLFVEVYENNKASMDIPVVRIVLTKKDYGNYFPKEGIWNSVRILNSTYYPTLIWDDSPAPNTWEHYKKRDAENILQDESDLRRIQNFCEKKWKSNNTWYSKINSFENDIANKKRAEASARKNKRRQEALNERAKFTPKLDLDALSETADRLYFNNSHYLYYKKNGRYATIGCSACGQISEGRFKSGISYESQFERHVSEPVRGMTGCCPFCGAYGVYKPCGNAKPFYSERRYAFTASPYKENGIIIRYVQFEKVWQVEITATEKGEDIAGASEHVKTTELARAYIEQGKDTQIDFHKYSHYTHSDFWDDCNLTAYEGPIRINNAPVLPKAYEILNETPFRYCQIKTYEFMEGSVNMIDYIDMYRRYPQIEFLVKLGLYKVVKEIISYRCGIIADQNSKKLHEFLGIRKEHTELLLKHADSMEYLRALTAVSCEAYRDMSFTENQISFMSQVSSRNQEILGVLEYMPMQKFINRVEKYSGVVFTDDCSATALSKLSAVTGTYIDYLNMRNTLGYDMNNTVYLFPKDLQNAHDRMAREQAEREDDNHIKNMMALYPSIQKSYRKLRREYYYEDDEYIIRPARSAKEIILEGRILHHCVGGSNYLSKHNDLKSIILFLRFKDNKEIPYITVEVNNNSKNMLQWYGEHDSKPDKEHMDEWLNGYIETLKKNQSTGNELVRVAV